MFKDFLCITSCTSIFIQQTLLHASQTGLDKSKDKKVNKYSGKNQTLHEIGDYDLVSHLDGKLPHKWYWPMQVVKRQTVVSTPGRFN